MLVREVFHDGSAVKNPPAMQKLQETWVQSLAQAGTLEEGMATHSSILCLKNPMDRGAWWVTIRRVAKSRTRLKWLSHSTHKLIRENPKMGQCKQSMRFSLPEVSLLCGWWVTSVPWSHSEGQAYGSPNRFITSPGKGSYRGRLLGGQGKTVFLLPRLALEWHPTLVFLPGKSHGQRSVVGYSQWGHKESDTTEQLSTAHSLPQRRWWVVL